MEREILFQMLTKSLPKVTAIIGGGGKTTLLNRFGEYLAERGSAVLLTTTTHMGVDDRTVEPKSVEDLNLHVRKGNAVLAGFPDSNRHKIDGIPVEWYRDVCADHILVEADGSKQKPLKVHRSYEPVVPESSGLMLYVVGLTAVGKMISEAVHCWETAELDGNGIVTVELIVFLVKRGIEASGHTGRTVVVLNQADNEERIISGTRIQMALEQHGIESVVTALKGDLIR